MSDKPDKYPAIDWDPEKVARELRERGTRNDSGLSPEAVANRLADGVSIEYGRFCVRIERHVLAEAEAEADGYAPDEGRQMMLSIERSLNRNIPRLLAGKFSKKRSDNTVVDLVLWHVLKQRSVQ